LRGLDARQRRTLAVMAFVVVALHAIRALGLARSR
jgi:hypothetical protein